MDRTFDPCGVNPNLPGCGTEPVDPCLTNPSAPRCQDPCDLNPDLPECPPPDPCIENSDLPQCPPPPCDPTKQQCPPQPIRCGNGTHLENGKCVPNKNNGGSSSSSSASSATASVTVNTAEVSSCRLDGSTRGIQQKFDTAKYLACGLYVNGQKAYADGFIAGCTQVGNTAQICLALVDSSILNTRSRPTQTPQTATQPTQPQQSIRPTQ
jgi:hypothetical protein